MGGRETEEEGKADSDEQEARCKTPKTLKSWPELKADT